MNISVVIPNFNGKNLLRKNIEKVLHVFDAYKKGYVEIIITDDASQDGSVDFIKEYIQKNSLNVSIQLLENASGKNKGFSTNVNKGVARATGDIVILLNTDVVPHADFLDPLIMHFKDDNVFAVGCMDESIESGKTVLRGRGVGKWRRGFLIHGPGKLDKTSTLWVGGGSGAFKKEIWDKLGGLNELYNPFYWEDIDISYRAQKAGHIVLFEKESVVQHEHETGSIKKNYKPSSIKKIAYRNQFYFTWLNATDRMILLSHIVFLPLFLLKALLKKDIEFISGFFMAVRNIARVMRERKGIQKLVKKSDKEIIERVSL